jgi:cell wall-associated NlpC family hydrolase
LSTRLRRLLPAFALAAAVIAVAAVAIPVARSTQDVDGGKATGRALVLKLPPDRRDARASTLGERAAAIALEAVGVPYRWGGVSPASGLDCSGLVYWAYGRLGVEVPHSSYALYGTGKRVPRSQLKPGDVLFFSGLGHVGLYLGHGRMIHAPYTGRRVEVVRLRRSHYGPRLVGARRVVPA